jgi:hypothetical protein
LQNRITHYTIEDPESFLANPMNHRVHPRSQRALLKESFESIGMVAPVIVNDVTGHLVDGHLRVDLALEHGWQLCVAHTSLTEEEERAQLAVHDTVTKMAVEDTVKLDELKKEMETTFPKLRSFMKDLSQKGEPAQRTCPQCGHQF